MKKIRVSSARGTSSTAKTAAARTTTQQKQEEHLNNGDCLSYRSHSTRVTIIKLLIDFFLDFNTCTHISSP